MAPSKSRLGPISLSASRLGVEAVLSAPANYTDPMAGAIAIIAVLAIFPVLIAMSGGLASAILGAVLQRDGERRFEGSELLDIDD